MTIKRLLVRRMPFHKLGVGLLVSGIVSFLVLAGMAPADATVSSSGNGLMLTVVSTQLVQHKTAVDVNLAVTCTPDPSKAAMFTVTNFTLSENIKHEVLSYQGGTGNTYPPITCDGTPHAVTFTIAPQNCINGCPFFKVGPAYITNGNAAAFPSDASCGTTLYGGQTVPLPCDSATFSGGVQIKG